ncbi:hypothetical protein Taro_026447 [Colocasia esculenta]|uniref:Uncharacterized protein n=1 Tax=Colocasia esculenta TaxID=4460 RepID=A0A843VBF0_COLES|nr:hypothetical protein [Colocasia esculenta]
MKIPRQKKSFFTRRRRYTLTHRASRGPSPHPVAVQIPSSGARAEAPEGADTYLSVSLLRARALPLFVCTRRRQRKQTAKTGVGVGVEDAAMGGRDGVGRRRRGERATAGRSPRGGADGFLPGRPARHSEAPALKDDPDFSICPPCFAVPTPPPAPSLYNYKKALLHVFGPPISLCLSLPVCARFLSLCRVSPSPSKASKPWAGKKRNRNPSAGSWRCLVCFACRVASVLPFRRRHLHRHPLPAKHMSCLFIR